MPADLGRHQLGESGGTISTLVLNSHISTNERNQNRHYLKTQTCKINNRTIPGYREPNESEVENNVIDCSRFLDNGHLWRFPVTSFCIYRLTTYRKGDTDVLAQLRTTTQQVETDGTE